MKRFLLTMFVFHGCTAMDSIKSFGVSPKKAYALAGQDILKIHTSDGFECELSVREASLSVTIKKLMEELGIEEPVPLLNISLAQWSLIQCLLKPAFELFHEPEDAKSEADIRFLLKSLSPRELIDIIKALNYLDIGILLSIALDIVEQFNITETSAEIIAQLPPDLRTPLIRHFLVKQFGPARLSRSEIVVCQRPIFSRRDPLPVFSADRQKVVAASDKTFSIWDIERMSKDFEWISPVTIHIFAVSEDLKTAALLCEDTSIRLLSIATGTVRRNKLENLSLSTEISVYGSFLAIKEMEHIGFDGMVSFWDIEKGTFLLRLDSPFFTYADKKVMAHYGTHIEIWSLVTGKLERTLEGHWIGVRMVKELIATRRTDNNTIVVWDSQNGTIVSSCKGHTGKILRMEFLDTEKIVSMSADGTIRMWEVKTGLETTTVNFINNIESCDLLIPRFSLDGRKMVFMAEKDVLQVRDLITDEQENFTSPSSSSFCIRHFGNKICFQTNGNSFTTLDLGTGKRVVCESSPSSDGIRVLLKPLSADQERIIVYSSDKKTIEVFDSITGDRKSALAVDFIHERPEANIRIRGNTIFTLEKKSSAYMLVKSHLLPLEGKSVNQLAAQKIWVYLQEFCKKRESDEKKNALLKILQKEKQPQEYWDDIQKIIDEVSVKESY